MVLFIPIYFCFTVHTSIFKYMQSFVGSSSLSLPTFSSLSLSSQPYTFAFPLSLSPASHMLFLFLSSPLTLLLFPSLSSSHTFSSCVHDYISFFNRVLKSDYSGLNQQVLLTTDSRTWEASYVKCTYLRFLSLFIKACGIVLGLAHRCSLPSLPLLCHRPIFTHVEEVWTVIVLGTNCCGCSCFD